MAKKLYEKYNLENGAYLNQADFFEEGEQPDGYTSVMKGDLVKAFLDIENQVAYEGATLDELNMYNKSLLPKRVSQRQLRTQLVLNDFNLNDIQLVIDSLPIPDRSIAQVAWDYAITFERESALLSGVAAGLGLTESQVDDIFANAFNL